MTIIDIPYFIFFTAVHRGLIGDIIKRFEQKGFKLVAMKMMHVSFINVVPTLERNKKSKIILKKKNFRLAKICSSNIMLIYRRSPFFLD